MYERESERLLAYKNRTLKHVAQYSPLISTNVKQQIANISTGRQVKPSFPPSDLPLSQLPDLLEGNFKLDVPVYTVWGACEDVRVLEKFRSGEYKVDNLHIIDEVNSRLLDVGGVKLRLLGLGGAVVIHKLFDNGEGKTYIAGGQGTMWTTLLQIGALIDTASRVYDPSETRIFLTHASPARDGILNQLSVTLKADFSISAGLHFRYGSSYNEFSVNPSLDHYRGKLAASKASFNDVWETVKMDVEQAISTNESHKSLLNSALEIVEKMPSVANGGNPFGGPVGGPPGAGQVDESAFKNMWNFNLADAAFGYLVLEVEGGRIGTEMRAQGFNFAHRGAKPVASQPPPQQTSNVAAPQSITSGAPAAVPTGPAQNRIPAFQPPAQPFPQPAQQTRAQQPPARPGSIPQQGQSTAAKSPTSNSPVPPIAQNKPLTPQPSSSNIPTTSSVGAKPGTPSATNGTGVGRASDTETAKSKPATPPVQSSQSSSLYVMFADGEDQARECIAEQDRSSIKTVSKVGNKFNNFSITFETHEIAEEALRRAHEQSRKVKNAQGKNPRVEWFRERGTTFHQRDNSTSGFNARGGAAAAGPTRGGYSSGGERASDSEGGRGRGGFSRGRGRGDRGRGRGMGVGRGSFQSKGDGPSDAKPADLKPEVKTQTTKDSS